MRINQRSVSLGPYFGDELREFTPASRDNGTVVIDAQCVRGWRPGPAGAVEDGGQVWLH